AVLFFLALVFFNKVSRIPNQPTGSRPGSEFGGIMWCYVMWSDDEGDTKAFSKPVGGQGNYEMAHRHSISLAALNMAMRVAAANAKDKGILVVMMCPGWVKTDLGGRDRGIMEPEESIATMINTLSTLDETHHGIFMDREGIPRPF
ncbi:hypothetical protein AVEN_155581-1, partial [Araneus ventricosus]